MFLPYEKEASPLFRDGCDHPFDCYLGRYTYEDRVCDVYVLYTASMGLEFCLRYDHRDDAYISLPVCAISDGVPRLKKVINHLFGMLDNALRDREIDLLKQSFL